MQVSSKLRVGESSGQKWYTHFCPACERLHAIYVRGKLEWSFNDDVFHPTFSPSVLCEYTVGEDQRKVRCHYFLENGILRYCSDSTHLLAGIAIPLPDLPEAYQDHEESVQ